MAAAKNAAGGGARGRARPLAGQGLQIRHDPRAGRRGRRGGPEAACQQEDHRSGQDTGGSLPATPAPPSPAGGREARWRARHAGGAAPIHTSRPRRTGNTTEEDRTNQRLRAGGPPAAPRKAARGTPSALGRERLATRPRRRANEGEAGAARPGRGERPPPPGQEGRQQRLLSGGGAEGCSEPELRRTWERPCCWRGPGDLSSPSPPRPAPASGRGRPRAARVSARATLGGGTPHGRRRTTFTPHRGVGSRSQTRVGSPRGAGEGMSRGHGARAGGRGATGGARAARAAGGVVSHLPSSPTASAACEVRPVGAGVDPGAAWRKGRSPSCFQLPPAPTCADPRRHLVDGTPRVPLGVLREEMSRRLGAARGEGRGGWGRGGPTSPSLLPLAGRRRLRGHRHQRAGEGGERARGGAAPPGRGGLSPPFLARTHHPGLSGEPPHLPPETEAAGERQQLQQRCVGSSGRVDPSGLGANAF